MGPRRGLAAGPAAAAIDAGAPSTSFAVVPGWTLDAVHASRARPRARGRFGAAAGPLATLSGALGSVPGRLAALVPPAKGQRGIAPAKGRRATPAAPQLNDTPSHHARHLAAGAASCAVTRTVLAPLERVKLDQVLRRRAGAGFRDTVASVWRGGGVAGFWAGNGVNLLRTCPHKAVNFFAFDRYKKGLIAATGTPDFGTGERFAAGALAGMTATALCFPLDVLRTRVMAGGGPKAVGGVRAAARALAAAEGARGFYTGLAPALAATAPSGAIFYGTYDVVKEAYLRAVARRTGSRPAALAARETLAFGALAGAAAELAMYPLEIVRRRMQLDAVAGGGAGARAAAAAILRERGARGLYAGLGANMLQVLPSAALSYYAYEVFKSALEVDPAAAAAA